MKRIVALTMVLSLVATLFITVPASAASTAPEDVELYRNRLSAMGVLSGDLDMDAEVSRGLMAAVVSEMFYVDNAVVDMGQIFSDVPPEHQYYIGINQAYLSGAINGNEDGTYLPDNPVTYAELAKTFVCLIGYETVANERGGYPLGYWTVASQKGLLPTGAQIGDNVAMTDFIYSVYQTMTASVMERTYSSSGSTYYVNDNHTLANDLMARKGITYGYGVLTSDGVTYIDGTGTKEDDIVIVDGTKYNCTEFDASPYLGHSVEFWYTTETKRNVYAMYDYMENNHVYEYSAEDISYIGTDRIEVNIDANTDSKSFSSDLAVVYNYQGLSEFTADDLDVKNGSVALVDNNGDYRIDVLFVFEKDSYVVDSVSNGGYSINYKRYDGQQDSGLFVDSTDDTVSYTVRDVDGNIVDPSTVGSGNVVSVFLSKDGKIVSVIVSKSVVSGAVEVVREGGAYVTILGVEYEAALDINGEYRNLNVQSGDVVSLYLDENGRAVYSSNNGSLSSIYAYIINYASDGIFGYQWKIKAAIAGDLGSVTNKDYYWVRDKMAQNASVSELDLADNVLIDEVKYDNGEVGNKLAELKNQVVEISLNSEGKVQTMDLMVPLFEYTSGHYDHNTQAMTQSGLVVEGIENPAITLTGAVKTIVAPASDDSERDSYTDDEYLAKYRIENGKDTHNVAVYEFIEDSQSPKLIVLKEKLTESGTAQGADDIGILTSPIAQGIDDNGDKCYYADYISKTGSQTSVVIRSDATANKTWSIKTDLSDLEIGDIVEFSKDSSGNVMSYQVIASASNPVASNLVKLGKVTNAEANRVWNEKSGVFCNIFYMDSEGESVVYGINTENVIFKYYKASEKIDVISVGDISSDVNVTYADTVMIASDIAVIIAE